jgi:hypothetical protein
MKMLWKVSALALLGFATLLPGLSAKAAPARSQPVSRGIYVPYAPLWGIAYFPPNGATGNVKIDIPVSLDGSVYVDGQFVGMTPHVSNIPASPGTHSVEVRGPAGYVIYLNNIGVRAGETTAVHPLSDQGNLS